MVRAVCSELGVAKISSCADF